MVQVYLTATGDNVPMYKLCDIADKLIQDNLVESERIQNNGITQIREENKFLRRQINDLTEK